MQLLDVYPLLPINIVKARGCTLWDETGQAWLDAYGGHAVISVGHTHPHYVARLRDQLDRIGFYSNAVINRPQEQLAELLGEISGYPDYRLFLCNSGAEANENALKLASFATGKKKFITFRSAFHGRTSAAVAATDDPSIIAPVNETDHFIFCPFNDVAAFDALFTAHADELAGVIVEGIQGIGGVQVPSQAFMQLIETRCKAHGAIFIADEIQSGYGRTGRFFAHQHDGVRPDIITTAKGMGNGFPIGGVLVAPSIPARHKMLGTTFGGNHLACAAGIAVLEIIRDEQLMQAAADHGAWLLDELNRLPQVTAVRGRGLMIGIDFPFPAARVAKVLREQHHILVGSANDPKTMRLLPPLSIRRDELVQLVEALRHTLTVPDPVAI